MTSHAALVARGWGKCCIVGAGAVHINLAQRTVDIGGTVLREGDVITLNGSKGLIYAGALPLVVIDLEQNRDLKDFLHWCDGIRKLGVRTNADTPADAAQARRFGADGDRPLPHRAHVLRRGAHPRDARDDPLRDRSRARAGDLQPPAVPEGGLQGDPARDGGAAGDDPPARPAAARVRPPRGAPGARACREHGQEPRGGQGPDRKAQRDQPDARPPRLPARHHLPGDHPDAGDRDPRGDRRAAGGEGRRPPRDHDPAGRHRARS